MCGVLTAPWGFRFQSYCRVLDLEVLFIVPMRYNSFLRGWRQKITGPSTSIYSSGLPARCLLWRLKRPRCWPDLFSLAWTHEVTTSHLWNFWINARLGAMMSLSLITVPVFLETTTQASQLLPQWARMYYYGHRVLPTMAIGIFLLYSYTSFKKRRARNSSIIFALAGVMTLGMIPFTFLFMVPTNNELFRLEAASKAEPLAEGIGEAERLVIYWGRLHIIRSLFPLTGAILGTVGTLKT